jgi:hypothetical protein
MLLNKLVNKNAIINTNKLNYEDKIIDIDKDGLLLESGIYIPMNNIIYIKFV